jgi:branched-chain amino acid transport system substrate-binding protein
MEDKKVKKVIVIVMVIGILLLGLTGIVSAQENIIKIGAAVSMTGSMAHEGGLVKDGYEVWEDWVNNHGGITAGGINYKVKMVYYDDESDPVRGAKLTEMLITQNKVNFLFGPFSSAITFATSAIAEKYKMITIAPQSNATKIFERGYKYIFSVLPPATMLLAPLAYMAENLDPKPEKVAIIVANDLFPLSCAEGFRDKCIELGFEVVFFEKYPPGSTDLSSLLTQAKYLNPDILLLAGYTADAMMVVRQCKELDLNAKIFIASEGVDIPVFTKELGADAEYWFGATWWSQNMKNSDKVFGTTADYVQICKDKFGPDYEARQHVATGSTAGILLQFAIEKADSIEIEKVREALSTLNLSLSTFPAIAFNEKGQNIKWEHPIMQVQNNKAVVVYPDSMQEKAPIYPTPEWKNR